MPKAVLVISGKGGVGKTLISVNLALRLKDTGAKVGLLDADFSASNTGYFLPLENAQMALGREEFVPLLYDGMEIFSIPLILGNRSVSMNGDQYSQLLTDAVTAAKWNAEYIIVDCPAGYGDELKTAAKVFSESLLGSIIVVQPAHELDARKALQLHKDLEMPILGLIENMSFFHAGVVTYKIFGETVVDKLGQEFDVPVFGKIPLSMKIRKQIEAKDPKLIETDAEPITNAINAILAAKPQKPGFLAKLKQFLANQIAKLLLEVMLAVNTEINIPGVQQQFGYPGGAIIRLNILNDDGQPLMDQPADWIINEGKLTVVKGEYHIDSQIDITLSAIKRALLGNSFNSDGSVYGFQDALRLGQMRIYGNRSMARGAFFMQHVFIALSQNQNAMKRIRPLLEVL
jgi:ATP-binding protein involved in chromosome partitioning